jgi:Protein of unknown function (DUF3667)
MRKKPRDFELATIGRREILATCRKRPTPMSNDPSPVRSTFVCPSCHAESAGRFCGECGERQPGSDDRSLRHYLDMLGDFFTSFDSKAFRSLLYLVSRPGFLSGEYLRGSRVRYAKPLSLFISINVAYYFSIALFGANTFTTPLAVQLHQNNYYPAFASRIVESRMQTEKNDAATFERRFNEKTSVLSRTLIFLFIPIYALVFQGLFFRKRRYLIEHAVVATHLWCFILLFLTIVVPLITALLMMWSKSPGLAAALAAHDNLVSVVLQIIIGVYMAVMLRRVYAVNIGWCVAASTLIAWSFFHIVWLYRFLLFVITAYSL